MICITPDDQGLVCLYKIASAMLDTWGKGESGKPYCCIVDF